MQLLDEIEKGVDMTKVINKQYIAMGRIAMQMVRGQITPKQAIQLYEELIYLTMPPVDSGMLIYRVPFRTEYLLLNKLAINLRREEKVNESLFIYERMMLYYKKSKVSMRYHAVPGLTLFLNYTGFLEYNNELKKADEIGKEGLKHSLECCRGDMAGEILANLSLVYGKMGMLEMEEKYLRYGYYLIHLYDRRDQLGIVRQAYEDKFHRNIDLK